MPEINETALRQIIRAENNGHRMIAFVLSSLFAIVIGLSAYIWNTQSGQIDTIATTLNATVIQLSSVQTTQKYLLEEVQLLKREQREQYYNGK